ncbi:hypothetical protein M388_00325 [Mesotoga sp. Brook.08.YT.4.2.5.4.]|nr:hypothetical protein M388_00325 [Mesotoga sp. Brook.08.YT.4.2.5.4.]
MTYEKRSTVNGPQSKDPRWSLAGDVLRLEDQCNNKNKIPCRDITG